MRLAAGIVLLVTCAAQAQVSVRLREVQPAPTAYGIVEWVVQARGQYANPFDAAEVAVDAIFTGPAGQTIKLPGFWHQPYRRDGRDARDAGRERLTEAGPGQWLIRFCPTSAGRWTMRASIVDRSGRLDAPAASLDVGPSTHAGFVRRSPHHWRYFQLDSGASYFPVGPNICWAGRGGLTQYEQWFGDLSRAGGNFARVWMSHPNRELETKAAGLGRYDLAACWHYDQILELAGREGLRCMLALNSYGDYIEGGHFGEGRWPGHPLNAKNGGPATRPADVFALPELRELYKRRLRYVIARYSAYPSLGFWEFFNEQDGAKGIVPPDWVAEMAAYLKANDPYQRLVTTSFSGFDGAAAVWKLPGIDLTQRHMYGGDTPMYEAVPLIQANLRAHAAYRKPHLIGEIGMDWKQSDAKLDTAALGTGLHNALWAAALSGSAGGAHHWWWDNYIAPKDLWHCYTGLAKFSAQVDWTHRRFEPIRLLSPMRPPGGEETFADVRLPADGQWGRPSAQTMELAPDGSIEGLLPGYLYGPSKPDLRGKLTLKATLPQPSRLTLRIATVSDSATIRILVDDQPAAEWPFSAKPGSPGQESTKQMDYGGYQAIFNKDCSIDLPAGPHTITLENTAGDWASIASLTLAHAISSRYSGLRILALSDPDSGETIAWLHDPLSHPGTDAASIKPKTFESLTMTLPAPNGRHRIQWWDTRRGEVVNTETISPEAGQLHLPIPPFQRDIALRVQRAD